MKEEFNLSEERKKIPQIVNITNAIAYKEGVKNALEIVEEQDKEFIKLLKEGLELEGESNPIIIEIIDKLAGKKLVDEK